MFPCRQFRRSTACAGKIVELTDRRSLFANPLLHPYTEALLSAVLVPDPKAKKRIILSGDVPRPDTATCKHVA